METQVEPSTTNTSGPPSAVELPPQQRTDPTPVDGPTTLTIVAVDGSDASIQALAWALREARPRQAAVEVLTLWPAYRHQLVRDVPGHFCEPRWQARSLQREAIRRALAGLEDPPLVTARLVNADVTDALIRESRRCDLLVLGAHDPGIGASRVRLTDLVAAQARCDVVVVDADGHASTTARPSPAGRTPVASADR